MEFNNIIGHDRQKDRLADFVDKDRLSHALLFAGPDGVGKKLIALDFTKNLFCEKKCACGLCRQCRNLSANNHPDFTLISKGSSIKIDELRAIRRDVYEPPFEAPLRVIVIDNCDLMTREAANALLKTLEEPPPLNLFILISSKEQEIPLTIRSRCMRIGFGHLTTDALFAYFRTIQGLSEEQAQLIAHLGNGSITAGLFWVDETHFSLRRRIAELVMGIKKGFSQAALIAEIITAQGDETRHLFFLLSFLRDIWWVATTGDSSAVANTDLKEIIIETCAGRQVWADKSIRRVQETLRTLKYNVNRWLAVECLMLDITRAA
jgi:DNA polymerase III subunit delta'